MSEYLTVKDVAEKVGVKPVTIYKWLKEGKLRGSYFKIGGVFRFQEDLLKGIIESMIKYNDTTNWNLTMKI